MFAFDEEELLSYLRRAYEEGWCGKKDESVHSSTKIISEINTGLKLDQIRKKPNMDWLLSEGDLCPECHKRRNHAQIVITMLEPCYCHMGHPPCGSCTSSILACEHCGWELEH